MRPPRDRYWRVLLSIVVICCTTVSQVGENVKVDFDRHIFHIVVMIMYMVMIIDMLIQGICCFLNLLKPSPSPG
jgi:hypothetical protein